MMVCPQVHTCWHASMSTVHPPHPAPPCPSLPPRSNNTSLDIFGLYRGVIKAGGLQVNERYDERGRWAGGVNFAGDVFPRMANWTANNKATSVGNQLLSNYKKFLLAYERAYMALDLPHLVGRADVAGSRLVEHRLGASQVGGAAGAVVVAARRLTVLYVRPGHRWSHSWQA